MPRAFALPVALLCLLEQLRSMPSYDKLQMRQQVARVQAAIPRDAAAFFYTGPDRDRWWSDQLDAMWASLESGIPTINGYSGNWPPELRELIWSDGAERNSELLKIHSKLLEWTTATRLDDARVAWIVQPASGTLPAPAEFGFHRGVAEIAEKSEDTTR